MPRVTTSRSSITSLSNRKLLSAITKLVKNEHLTTTEILVHLNEVEKRDLHLKLGCSSLFDYCVNHLGYSRSAAGRRIQAARCIKRFPDVHKLMKKKTLNLTTVALIAPVLTEANKTQILDCACNKSQDKTEALVAGYRPPIAFQDRVKPVRVAVPQNGLSELHTKPALLDESRCGTTKRGTPPDSSDARQTSRTCTHQVEQTSNCTITESAGNPPSRTHHYEFKRKLLIQFLAGETFMKKYAEARSLLSNKLTDVSFEKVFEALLNEFIDRHSPMKKNERRAKRDKAAKSRSRGKTPENKSSVHPTAASNTKESRSGTDIMLTSNDGRRIPAKTRDAVFERDKNRCTYVGANGRQCRSTHRLHIDHIVPFARGGTNARSNLRLLCAKHNNLEARKFYGKAKIDAHCRHE